MTCSFSIWERRGLESPVASARACRVMPPFLAQPADFHADLQLLHLFPNILHNYLSSQGFLISFTPPARASQGFSRAPSASALPPASHPVSFCGRIKQRNGIAPDVSGGGTAISRRYRTKGLLIQGDKRMPGEWTSVAPLPGCIIDKNFFFANLPLPLPRKERNHETPSAPADFQPSAFLSDALSSLAAARKRARSATFPRARKAEPPVKSRPRRFWPPRRPLSKWPAR